MHGHADNGIEQISDALKEALEDAIYYSLDAEQGAPHSGVDMAIVVDEFIKYLAHRGYEIKPTFEARMAAKAGERCINRPLPDRFLGPCPALLSDNYGERVCNVELTAARADDHVQCPSCKTAHRVGELHEQQMRITDAMSFTLSQLYRMILPISREYVPLRTLQQWVSRGKLVPTGYDADGEPRFLLADVRELRDRKPQGKPTGAAAHKSRRAS
jgi:hypothetical protein